MLSEHVLYHYHNDNILKDLHCLSATAVLQLPCLFSLLMSRSIGASELATVIKTN